ncbi:SPON1 [Symbiodinium necroappetens]|uniref:SPON1 protein n=1 Tax=Symbiodinium necroappetens TaxID=1628268 RepID=A0A813BVK8_9DINO|nr:SPON1 [Symbiodinium necroappetens]
MALIRLLALSWLGRARADEDEKLDTAESCWVEDPLGSKSNWAKHCCRPKPCGQSECWVPPMYTYESRPERSRRASQAVKVMICFAMFDDSQQDRIQHWQEGDEDACRNLAVEEVKRALDLAVEAPHKLDNQSPIRGLQSDAVPTGTDPEAFRKMRGLQAELSTADQACTCGIAFAVATLLWYPEDSAALELAIKPRWFLEGVDWGRFVEEGWSSIFKWLDRFPHVEGKAAENVVHSLHEEFEDLAERRQSLLKVVRHEQEEVTLLLLLVSDLSISDVIRELRERGVFQRVWRHVMVDLAWRQKGQKCAVGQGTEGEGRWLACEPWEYHLTANFSSVSERDGPGGLGKSNVAVCVLGAPRTVVKTYESIREKVVETLKGDAFIYVPFSGTFTPALEEDLRALGPAVTAIVVPDVDRRTFEERTQREFYDPRLWMLYSKANGPWRAPMFRQMGSSMWGYHNQHCCRRMVESFEQQRGWEYEWVVFARAEMVWVHYHPPIEVLSPNYVYIPMGQDNSFYNFNDLKGINDRHAAVPKRWFKSYFNRWECLLNGNAWKYLAKVAKAGYMINTEQYLWLHLQAEGVQVRRFAPVSFLSHCTEGPQCQHLYKGTDLGKVRWTQTAKYWTEMLESRRTIVDDFHYVKRPEKGWIWLRQRPPVPLIWGAITKKQFEKPLEDVEPQEKVGADLALHSQPRKAIEHEGGNGTLRDFITPLTAIVETMHSQFVVLNASEPCCTWQDRSELGGQPPGQAPPSFDGGSAPLGLPGAGWTRLKFEAISHRPSVYNPGNYTNAQRSASIDFTGPVDQSLHIPAAQLIHVVLSSFLVDSFLPKDTPLAGCHGFEEHWALCTETPCSDLAQRIDCAWGAWGQWESFGGCSGLGLRSRKIFRMNSEGGAPCSGVKEETMQMDKYFDSDCLMGNRDCEWSPWTDWSHCGCDVCGEDRKAQTVRVRHIANQALGTGKACAGKFNMTKTCGFEMPVQCSLSEWGQWTRCSATCGGGVRASLRRVEKEADYGGLPCVASLRKTETCNTHPCERSQDCVVSEWGRWHGCEVEGAKQMTRQRRIETYAEGDGEPCDAPLTETAGCDDRDTLQWCSTTEWSQWTACPVACGGGQQQRSRHLSGESSCIPMAKQDLKEVRGCNVESCEENEGCILSPWTHWGQCSQDCGTGVSTRSRSIDQSAGDGGKSCHASLKEMQECVLEPCPVRDCVWHAWDSWSGCSCTCGGGLKRRARNIKVAPRAGGTPCDPSDKTQVAACNTQSCEDCVDGRWTIWSLWSECTASCAPGYRWRHRSIARRNNDCGQPVTGLEEDYQMCEDLPICVQDEDCKVSDWTSWNDCSCSCYGVTETALEFVESDIDACSSLAQGPERSARLLGA